MLGKEKRDVQFFPLPLSPFPRFSLCMIHNRAEHLTAVSAAPSPASGTTGWGSPIRHHGAQPTRLHITHQDTHLHSPGNSLRLGTATTREKQAGSTGRKRMDRSTGRVVVPFSGCAAPSLHPCWRCRVGERSPAIEESAREQSSAELERRQEERERRRR